MMDDVNLEDAFWKMKPKCVAWNDEYVDLFNREKEVLLDVLPKGAVLNHFGSSSVPGLPGKGIIDIWCTVGDPEEISNSYAEKLRVMGYQRRRCPQYRFDKVSKEGCVTVCIHLSTKLRHNAVEEFLRSAEGDSFRQEYAQVKEGLIHGTMLEYRTGKQEILSKMSLETRKFLPWNFIVTGSSGRLGNSTNSLMCSLHIRFPKFPCFFCVVSFLVVDFVSRSVCFVLL